MRWALFLTICAYCAHNFTAGKNSLDNEKYRDVRVQTGVVRGHVAKDGPYMAFLGIPYAAPPVGNNRFKAPLPPIPFKGIYDATRTIKCPQRGKGGEDCLVVNVFTPLNVNNETLPVLVYIHGGSFLIGEGQTQGVGPLVQEGLIVVTINYRLGVLGFLCLGIEEAPGNAGLKDQVAALKWVRDNISSFGGDPDHVTVYGMSAGAASVELLILSKMAKGLFSRAIVESASGTAVWTCALDPIGTAKAVAMELQFPTLALRNLYKLIAYYKKTPADLLSQTNYEYYTNLIDGSFGFVPCVERYISGVEPFMTRAPYDLLNKDNYDKVPMMIFFASLEGLFLRSTEYYEQNYKEKMNQFFPEFLPADLQFDTTEIKDEVAKNVKQFYFGNATIDDQSIIDYLNYFGDHLILHGLLNSVEIHSKKNNPVYLLQFSYRGNMGTNESFYNGINQAGHGDIVKHAILKRPVESEQDRLTVARVVKLIANFVKHGHPTPESTKLLPVRWPRARPKNVSYLHLDKEFIVLEEPYWGRKLFWDKLYGKFRKLGSTVNPKVFF